MAALVGIFVGGASSRMGGSPKGLLPAPDGAGTLVARLVALAASLGLEVVLVGVRPEYAALGVRALADAAPDAGPLGGLVALLREAGDRPAIALACDMPFVDRSLVERLLAVPPAPIVAPRRDDRWEPLVARYAPEVLPIAERRLERGELALQRLLDEAGAVELPLGARDSAQLADWDSPEDIR